MPKNTPVRAKAAKKTATKKTTSRAPRASRPAVKENADLEARWPGSVVDNLPNDVRPAVVAIETIIAKSAKPRQTISALRELLAATRNSDLAAYVAELRLCSYRRGFLSGFVDHFKRMEGDK